MTLIKNNTDLKSLRQAGQIAGWVCDEVLKFAEPGFSTLDLDSRANQLLGEKRSSAPFKSFDGFGHSICVSLNDETVNGPPSQERILKAGDLVSIAIGTEYRGMHGKAARTCYLGESPPEATQRLMAGTEKALEQLAGRSIETLNDVAYLMADVANSYQLTLVKDSFGTGIGKKLHDAPVVVNNPDELTHPIPVEPGVAFVVMSMMTLSESGEWIELADGWTQVIKDGSLSAHVADAFLVTENGLEILTRTTFD